MNPGETDEEYMGRVNYEAWRDAHGGTDSGGHTLLTWDEMGEWMRKPWIAGAQAVACLVEDTMDVE